MDSVDELKTLAAAILRVLAKDVLLSQVHQGPPMAHYVEYGATRQRATLR